MVKIALVLGAGLVGFLASLAFWSCVESSVISRAEEVQRAREAGL